MRITFVVAVNDRKVLEQNLLLSPCVAAPHEILIQEGFVSAAMAYNDALQRASNDLIVFVHQDMFLPEPWLFELERCVQYLDRSDPSWGVIGCWGARADGSLVGHLYSSGWGILGTKLTKPVTVQTLDEVMLILKRQSGLLFDHTLPHFHFYGTDICMRAAERGLTSYVMPSFCIHNTRQLLQFPHEFYRAYFHVKRRWKTYLPIQTSCIRISRFDNEVIRRKIQAVLCLPFNANRGCEERAPDPRRILESCEILPNSSL